MDIEQKIEYLEKEIKHITRLFEQLKKNKELENIPEIKLPIDKKWRWVAMDEDRKVWVYDEKPEIVHGYWIGGEKSEEIEVTKVFPNFYKNVNWKESLRKIKHTSWL